MSCAPMPSSRPDFGDRYAGLTPDPVRWTLPAREAILVLEGRARIEIEGGPTLELKPGAMASLPEGATTTWHLTPDFKEFWVLSKPVAEPSPAFSGSASSLTGRRRRAVAPDSDVVQR